MAAFLADTFHLDPAPAPQEQSDLMALCEELRMTRKTAREARAAWQAMCTKVCLQQATEEERMTIPELLNEAEFQERCAENLADMIVDEPITTTEEAIAKLRVARAHSTKGAVYCKELLGFVLIDEVIGFLKHCPRA